MSKTVSNLVYKQQHGKWTVTAHETVELSWSKYSRGWHRTYGPARSVLSRYVIFNSGKQRRIRHVKNWRGDWLARAVVAAGLAPRNPKAPKYIRLSPAYDAHIIRAIGQVQIWERTLLSDPHDYVAVAGTHTYHAPTVREALAGLNHKHKTQIELRRHRDHITWTTGEKLGFCKAGMQRFCEELDLDPGGVYRADEIHQRLQSHPETARTFAPELRTLARALQYPALVQID